MRKRTLTILTLNVVVATSATFALSSSSRVDAQQDAAQDLAKPLLPVVQADIELTAENYATWRDHIQPDLSELAWEEIPWRTTFKDGITAADAAGKPLLLWTMNGHPLGCT